MKKISLRWYGLGSVADLSEKLKQHVSTSDEQHPFLGKWGFYMYLDQNQSKAIYIGQAFGEGRSLRNRIRHEVLKDNSSFSHDCKNLRIDKFSLILKVAHVEEATDNGNPIEYNPYDIEMALICEMQPKINRIGKRRYRRESIEIFNSGDFNPSPDMFKKVTGEKCRRRNCVL